jgi:transcriptional regulator with XRE-family HTH domain
MKIGWPLRELRVARGLSQGDMEKCTGLVRCYISRVENGHTEPSLTTLERWAKALGIELYQNFYSGNRPTAAAVKPAPARNDTELILEGIAPRYRTLIYELARGLKQTENKKGTRK